jgi:hypothetical protein
MRRVRSILAWFIFIAAAFALPAAAVRVHDGRFSPCDNGCLMPALSKWSLQQIKKYGLPPQSVVAKNASRNFKWRALAVSDPELSR